MSARNRRWTRRCQGAILAALAGLTGACSDYGQRTPPRIEHLPLAALPGSAQPNLATGPFGQLVLSWQEPAGDGTALRFATLDGDGWSEPRTVATGGRWFVNWADFPSVVPIDDGFWAAHWLARRDGGTYAYDVAVAVSNDAGASWSPAMTPHRDGTATEHGFVSLFPVDGKAGLLWLDGRNMGAEGAHDHAGGGAMTLRSATIDRDATPGDPVLVDDRVCDCCQTDVALSGTTPVAVYRDRGDGEIRDIYVTRLIATGWTTGAPVARDNWEISGCPVNGPAIAAQGQRIGVAWFTAAGSKPRVRYAVSDDGGDAFGSATDIAAGDTLGRVDVVLLEDGSAVVSHLRDAGDGTAHIVLRFVAPDGIPGRTLTAATTGAGRLAGFPQLARYGQGLVLVWVDTVNASVEIRSARISLGDWQ